MSALVIKVCNALRQPLDDMMDVQVVAARTDAIVAKALDVSGTTDVRVEGLIDHQPYIVKVFPTRHRPVAQFAIPKPGRDVTVQLYAPLDPDRVRSAKFPAFEELPEELSRVLSCSTVEGVAGCGDALYGSLTDLQRAGLINLFTKMSNFGFDEQRNVWSFVEAVYRIRPDRIFIDVQPSLRDLVKGAVPEGRFRPVSGKLHVPPPGFLEGGSFKTSERYGNLQLSFFASSNQPLRFKVDADIDDAAGLGHAFQVLRNWVTDGTTHPYDVHQILVFRQEVELPYELA